MNGAFATLARGVAPLAFLAGAIGLAPGAWAAPLDMGAPTARLALDMGKGRLIHLDGPAASVFIGDEKIADVQVKSPTTVYVIGKALGETTLMAVNARDGMLANIEIDVGYDLDELRRVLKQLMPESDITVSTANSTVVLSGEVASVGESETAKTIATRFVPDADHVLNALRVAAPNQVNLRVRVVEVSRDIIKAFGVTWGSSVAPGKFTFGIATGTGGIASNAPSLQGLNTISAAFKSGNVDLNAVIDALDSEGLVTVLAEPNLTAESGAPASFLSGGEYPIPVPQGLGQVTVDFKKYGVSLAMVATITYDGRINLVVEPEVSQLSNTGAVTLNGITIPALTTQHAKTTVDLASGQSFAIAGLLQNNINHQIQKFPGLGNIPVLGAAFRSDRFERNESELLVVVTPYIVHPSNHVLAVPTTGYIAPTDAARILNGADYTPVPPGASAPDGRRAQSGANLVHP